MTQDQESWWLYLVLDGLAREGPYPSCQTHRILASIPLCLAWILVLFSLSVMGQHQH